jgi:NADH:ubiquinone oxidoreductase subunit E
VDHERTAKIECRVLRKRRSTTSRADFANDDTVCVGRCGVSPVIIYNPDRTIPTRSQNQGQIQLCSVQELIYMVNPSVSGG